MKVKRRIWALPVISIVIFGLGLALSVYLSTKAINSISNTEQVDYPALESAKALILDVKAVGDGVRKAASDGDKSALDGAAALGNQVKEKIRAHSAIPGQAKSGDALMKSYEAYLSSALSAARIMLDIEQGDQAAVSARMQENQGALNKQLTALNESAQKQFKEGIAASGSHVRSVLTTSVLVAVVVSVVLVGVSFFVIRAIWSQLGGEPEYAREIAQAVASGDLSMHIAVEPGGEDSLLAALNEMKAKLGGMMGNIKSSAATIKTASSEIASGNADLSSRTESQASSLEETASSMEALTDTVRQNAENARQANELVVTASSIAVKGGNVVNQVVSTMGDINESARKIVEIISVIDGIAFQTNILALNAAVEAARAGEQGRGFAVVASEVRNLAQRSAAAAKEIKGLIGDSVEKVGVGSRLVDEAGHTMGEIVASVKRVADIMGEITAASEAQSAGIGEVGQAINQMDEMTQQNSALVEEAAAAAESLEEQADQLRQALTVFKLDQGMTTALALR
jgi:methyl-accepting chemotaxis protein